MRDLKEIVRLHAAIATGKAVTTFSGRIIHIATDNEEPWEKLKPIKTQCRVRKSVAASMVHGLEDLGQYPRVCQLCTRRGPQKNTIFEEGSVAQ